MTAPGKLDAQTLEWLAGVLKAQERAQTSNHNWFLAKIMAIEARLNNEQPLDDEEDVIRLAAASGVHQALAGIHTDLVVLEARLESKQQYNEQLQHNQEQMITMLGTIIHTQQQLEQAIVLQRILTIVGVTAVFMLVFLRFIARDRSRGNDVE